MISISGLGFTFLQNFQVASGQPSISSISVFWLHPPGRQPNMISISGLRFAFLQNFQLDSKPRITSISGFWLHPRGRLPNMTSISGFWPEHDQHQWVGVHFLAELLTSQRAAEHHQLISGLGLHHCRMFN